MSASGTYPHSGSQMPRGFLPKYLSYVWTPTAIWAFTVFSLTYNIGNVGVELKENSNTNRQDIDIAAFTYNDAKYIRKEMQVNNEELYLKFLEYHRDYEGNLGYLLCINNYDLLNKILETNRYDHTGKIKNIIKKIFDFAPNLAIIDIDKWNKIYNCK